MRGSRVLVHTVREYQRLGHDYGSSDQIYEVKCGLSLTCAEHNFRAQIVRHERGQEILFLHLANHIESAIVLGVWCQRNHITYTDTTVIRSW